MGKYLIFSVLFLLINQTALSVDLELSDVIKEARESQMKLAKSQIQQNVAKTKQQLSQNTNNKGEQNAVEKLNPQEILKSNDN